jgi:Spy/CpxP family protein refolding chaperone
MSGSRQPQPRDNPSAELQELRSQRSLLEAIALDQRKIRKLLAKLQVYSMALPELIETAVATEIEEGMNYPQSP